MKHVHLKKIAQRNQTGERWILYEGDFPSDTHYVEVIFEIHNPIPNEYFE